MPVDLYYIDCDTIFENLSYYDTAYRIFSNRMRQLTIQKMLDGE